MKNYPKALKTYEIRLYDAKGKTWYPKPTHIDNYGIPYYNEFIIHPPYLEVETFDIKAHLKHVFKIKEEQLIEY